MLGSQRELGRYAAKIHGGPLMKDTRSLGLMSVAVATACVFAGPPEICPCTSPCSPTPNTCVLPSNCANMPMSGPGCFFRTCATLTFVEGGNRDVRDVEFNTRDCFKVPGKIVNGQFVQDDDTTEQIADGQMWGATGYKTTGCIILPEV